MKFRLAILVLLLHFLRVKTQEPLLCSKCACPLNKNTTPFVVNCTSMLLEVLPTWDDYFLEGQSAVLDVHLLLDTNNFQGIPQLTDVPSLVKLSLEGNNISSIPSGAFQLVRELKYLSLGFNQIDKIEKGAFAIPGSEDPLALEVLDLNHNYLYHLDDDVFDHLPNLYELRLSHNPFRHFDASTVVAMSKLHALRVLDISETEITELPDLLVNPISRLTALNLSGNSFAEVPKLLKKCTELQSLDMSWNILTNLSGQSFEGLKNLTQLTMSYITTLKNLPAGVFHPLEKLDNVRISHNRNLRVVDPESFVNHEGKGPNVMRSVDLSFNDIVYLESSVFHRLEIGVLNLQHNPFNCTCHLKWLSIRSIPDNVTEDLKCSDPDDFFGSRVKDVDFETAPCPKTTPGSVSIHETVIIQRKRSPAGAFVGLTVAIVLGSIVTVLITVLIVKRRSLLGYTSSWGFRSGPNTNIRYVKAEMSPIDDFEKVDV